ncbi:MAG: nickel-type superoxide dismutase maturation protease [Myxococcota bacterium]|nr:nickel-type superoxide dismutase maturation protease [Myxococcota bacterium]
MPVAAAALARAVGGPFWFRVRGRSMLPTLEGGDAVLIWPRSPRRIPVGALVVADDPEDPGRTLVKRVRAVADSGLVVCADNHSEGRDSRHFGPIPPHRIRGQVLLVWSHSGTIRLPPLQRS